MAGKPAPRHCLIRIKSPGRPDRIEDLLGRRYVFGRGDPEGKVHVDFLLPGDPHLSRAHCHLEKQGDGYAVCNLSPNGTLVNGRPIEEPLPLKPKDRIEIGGGTVLEFLRMSDAERSRELGAAVAAKEEAAGVEKTKANRGLLKSPWMWGMLGFYALLAVIVASAVGGGAHKVTDPGSGPYFEGLLTHDLEPQETSAITRRESGQIWTRALREHGGELLGEGPHAYYLVQQAQRALALLGYGSLREAAARKEPIATVAADALNELEARISNLYREARQYRKARLWAKARALYARIRDAVPDRDAAVRRYAVYMIRWLRKQELKDRHQ